MIIDPQDVRKFAVEMAVKLFVPKPHGGPSPGPALVEAAQAIEAYLIGESKTPDSGA